MSISAIKFDDRTNKVTFTKDFVQFSLVDGRIISAPLAWFPRLERASENQRQNWRLIGDGIGVHWPDLDEDIEIKSLMHTHASK